MQGVFPQQIDETQDFSADQLTNFAIYSLNDWQISEFLFSTNWWNSKFFPCIQLKNFRFSSCNWFEKFCNIFPQPTDESCDNFPRPIEEFYNFLLVSDWQNSFPVTRNTLCYRLTNLTKFSRDRLVNSHFYLPTKQQILRFFLLRHIDEFHRFFFLWLVEKFQDFFTSNDFFFTLKCSFWKWLPNWNRKIKTFSSSDHFQN